VRLSRVYVETPLAAGERAILTGDAANHVARVMRARVGDPLTLFDGRGGEYQAHVSELQGAKVIADVGEHQAIERESSLDITLLQGIARSDRMDAIVQKATELGVTRIVPVATERSVVKLAREIAHRKHAHWLGVAIAACEQCGRNRLPEVAQPQTLADAIRTEASLPRQSILLAPGGRIALSAVAADEDPITLLIGPEGGLAPTEVELALQSGFVACRVGPRILRTETASLAAIAALQAIAGDFLR
jgi:16S rRNA (uracil1498-N3)-methyltransferase